MSRVTSTFEVDEERLARLLAPRDDLVREQAAGALDGVHRFELADGPFRHYRRVVEVEPGAEGGSRAHQEVDFDLAIPVWGWLFSAPVKAQLRRLPPRPGRAARPPWWSPPDRMDARQATVLGLLAALALIAGYLGTLLSQTITFAASEFDASDTEQGLTLAAVRVGVLVALVLVALADRRGRRRMLIVSAAAGCLVTATGALAPGMAALGASQTVARGLSTALAVLIGIVAVEEMPAGSRAYAVSVLAMSGALGAGGAVIALPLADLGIAAWRLLYLLPLAFLGAVIWVGRRLPETRRYLAHRDDRPEALEPDAATARAHRRRFGLLAASGFLGAIFAAPASQFMNEFLRSERGFSAARISLFTLATNTPGGIGIIVGGRLADTRGRRVVGAVGLLGGTAMTVAMFIVAGAPMWLFSVAGAVVGAATVPALGVYGPELFPTNLRGRANAGLTLLAVAGSAAGLIAAGVLSDRLGSFGPAMTLLAIGPAVLALLVLAFYPETAHLELEEINPEDRRDP